MNTIFIVFRNTNIFSSEAETYCTTVRVYYNNLSVKNVMIDRVFESIFFVFLFEKQLFTQFIQSINSSIKWYWCDVDKSNYNSITIYKFTVPKKKTETETEFTMKLHSIWYKYKYKEDDHI